ncbi:MAG: hypothetical protein D6695_12430, partial [Planctomycetota bacterium]
MLLDFDEPDARGLDFFLFETMVMPLRATFLPAPPDFPPVDVLPGDFAAVVFFEPEDFAAVFLAADLPAAADGRVLEVFLTTFLLAALLETFFVVFLETFFFVVFLETFFLAALLTRAGAALLAVLATFFRVVLPVEAARLELFLRAVDAVFLFAAADLPRAFEELVGTFFLEGADFRGTGFSARGRDPKKPHSLRGRSVFTDPKPVKTSPAAVCHDRVTSSPGVISAPPRSSPG